MPEEPGPTRNQPRRKRRTRRGPAGDHRPAPAPVPEHLARELDAMLRRADACAVGDAESLRRRLGGVRRAARAGRDTAHALGRIAEDLARAEDLLERRRLSIPVPEFPEDLPIAAKRDTIAAAFREHQVIVVCGETGSGKTTQLPKICLAEGRGVFGTIGHTQPRRIAARSLSSRIAEELGLAPGKNTLVGTKVRFTDETGPETLVKVMTDGILLAESQSDPDLLRYDTLIIDEAHERSLNIDFLLGYLRRILPRRPDLKLIITSATIDTERFAEHFTDEQGNPAPVIEVSGRTYPVDVHYRPLVGVEDADSGTQDGDARDADTTELPDAVVDALCEIERFDPSGSGDVLVFMPGEREIRESADAIGKHYNASHHHGHGSGGDIEILPLYARLSTADQQRIFKPHTGRRIVISTNVAETSLTVPGIRFVIDPGLARISRYSTRSKTLRLPVEAVSQASANQRKGRCGRIGPGTCLRLYAEDDFETRPEYTDPEIRRTNLASVILQMTALGLGAVEDFPFIDPPEARQIRDGYDTLFEVGAIDEHRQLTEAGKRLARLPVDPRVGRMLLAGSELGCLEEALVIAAALTVQDPRERPHDRRDEADRAHEEFRHEKSDFLTLLNIWNWQHHVAASTSRSRLKKACRQAFLSVNRMQEWRDTARQLRELCAELGLKRSSNPEDEQGVHRAVLAGMPTSVGKKGDGFEYEGPRGIRFHIFPGSGLFKEKPRWTLAGELVRTTKLYARSVAAIEPAWVEDAAAHLVHREHAEPRWDRDKQHVIASERVTLHGLELIAKRPVHYGPIDPETSRELFIHHALVLGELRTRAPFMNHNRGVMAEVKKLEDKARRTDLIASEQARFAFFDRRLPERVYSLSTFDRWRKRAEREDPDLLFMTKEDLLVGEAAGITEQNYPSRLDVGPTDSPVGYKFDPGMHADGVTAVVPIEALAQLKEENIDRLVPGMVREKIVELVRTLPKAHRRVVGPAPEFADAMIAAGIPDGVMLTRAISEHLGRTRGVAVPENAFEPDHLPAHLKVNLRVVDEKGKELASGRDLTELREQLGERVRAALTGIEDDRFNRKGLTAWDFDDLPDQITIKRSGMTLPAFPAIVDEGETAALRLAETADAAHDLTRYGVRRLLVRSVQREIGFQLDHLPNLTKLSIYHAPLGSGKQLRRMLADLAAEMSLGDRLDGVRTFAAFQELANHGWDQLVPSCTAAADLAERILKALHELSTRLADRMSPSWAGVQRDVERQLAHLCPPGFLSAQRVERLEQYPRYLRAAGVRIDKLRTGGLSRDQKGMAEFLPLWRRYSDDAEKRRGQPEFVAYRWMLEELRVSLFAQEVGVATKVSVPRLEAQWQLVLGKG